MKNIYLLSLSLALSPAFYSVAHAQTWNRVTPAADFPSQSIQGFTAILRQGGNQVGIETVCQRKHQIPPQS